MGSQSVENTLFVWPKNNNSVFFFQSLPSQFHIWEKLHSSQCSGSVTPCLCDGGEQEVGTGQKPSLTHVLHLCFSDFVLLCCFGLLLLKWWHLSSQCLFMYLWFYVFFKKREYGANQLNQSCWSYKCMFHCGAVFHTDSVGHRLPSVCESYTLTRK